MAVSGIPSISFSSLSPSNSNPSIFLTRYYHSNLKQSPKRAKFLALSANHVTAEGVSMNDFFANEDVSTNGEGEKFDAAQYQALLTGGEQVTSVLEEMIKIVKIKGWHCQFFYIGGDWRATEGFAGGQARIMSPEGFGNIKRPRILKWGHPDLSDEYLFTLAVISLRDAASRDLEYLAKPHCRKLAGLITSPHHLEAQAAIPEDQRVTVAIPAVPESYYLLARRVKQMAEASRRKMDPPLAIMRLRAGENPSGRPVAGAGRRKQGAKVFSSPRDTRKERESDREKEKRKAPRGDDVRGTRGDDRASKQSKAAGEASNIAPRSPASRSTSLEVVDEQQVVASLVTTKKGDNPKDTSYLGWDPIKIKEYNPTLYPGRGATLHHLSVVKNAPSSLRDIPDLPVRRATEMVPRAWTKSVNTLVANQSVSDNVRLVAYNASHQLVQSQVLLDQVMELERKNRDLGRRVEKMDEEKTSAIKECKAEHAKELALMEEKMEASLAGEKDALDKAEKMLLEVKSSDLRAERAEKERADLSAHLIATEEHIKRLEEERKGMIDYEVHEQEVLDKTNFGYISAFAECLRSVHFAYDHNQDIHGAVKADFIEYVKNYPPAPGSTLFVSDLAALGFPLDVFDEEVGIAAPTYGGQPDPTPAATSAAATDEVFEGLPSLPLNPIDGAGTSAPGEQTSTQATSAADVPPS